MKLAFALPLLAGCAQLLGLDDTKFDSGDGGIDAPSVCDGVPMACTATTNRTVCGQLFGVNDTANVPFRLTAPAGMPCLLGDTEGPCGLVVTGMPMQSFFDGSATGSVQGEIDDCGRFVVKDIDVAAADIAVVFNGTGFEQTATVVIGRETTVGQDTGVRAYAVTDATVMAWSDQIAPGMGVDVSTGYLVEYHDRGGAPVANDKVAIDMGSAFANPPGTVPWAAYFSGSARFGAVDPTQPATGESGTALAVLPGGTFGLEGLRMGARCKSYTLQQVGNTLIHVVEVDC